MVLNKNGFGHLATQMSAWGSSHPKVAPTVEPNDLGSKLFRICGVGVAL